MKNQNYSSRVSRRAKDSLLDALRDVHSDEVTEKERRSSQQSV